ncbi:F-box/kelch-repeat protein At3g06240-like [Papaver somniferum]|uniref:F-box/kelch-repeat protein At3g06240-like n=1 Tax=Papaver somniferum TaxID=3469 RepID=UPI000E6F5144|nr:F-box/kelch-repeat protein At3g06240-like [Papaver somniferum]
MDNPVVKVNGVESRHMKFLGSCNGLLCLGASGSHTLILWNPSTNEYKEIILPKGEFPITCYGFGYDTKIKDYKLLCITQNEVHAYTLKSNPWRRFNTVTHGYVQTGSAGLLLNGVLHWSASYIPDYYKFILSFDIGSEKFMNMPYPEKIIQGNQTYLLGVLGDSLCLVCGIDDVRVDVWVIQNYGVRESWVKKFTTAQVRISAYSRSLKFYWSFKNEEILIQVRKGFALYGEKNDRIRFLNFD